MIKSNILILCAVLNGSIISNVEGFLSTVPVTVPSFYHPSKSKTQCDEFFNQKIDPSYILYSTTDASPDISKDVSVTETSLNLEGVKASILESMSSSVEAANEWSDSFGFSNQAETTFYALFLAIRNSCTLGVKGAPFHLKENEILNAMTHDSDGISTGTSSSSSSSSSFIHFFTMNDLKNAVNNDFLDAQRGSTDNRKGWKVSAVSEALGKSFQDAKMTFEQVSDALTKGTVIFNAIGAHVPKLAGSTLACTDATSLSAAVNMYVTAPNKRTSAPPHTDKQDVVVVQTQGSKRWRVFRPTNPDEKPEADVFARGKGDDNLPLYRLLEREDDLLLLDVTLNPGDVLFIPAAFPHTTDTITSNESEIDETSIHLTFGLDTHVWDLNYLSLRRFALRKAGVKDIVLGQMRDEENPYIGAVNQLPDTIRNELYSSLPLGFLDDDAMGGDQIENVVVSHLQKVSHLLDSETALAAENVNPDIWKDTTNRIRLYGMEILDIHRDMYLAAIEEGDIRKAEDSMAEHLHSNNDHQSMSPERMQRLSLFRVKKFYDQINNVKSNLNQWSHDVLVTNNNNQHENNDSKTKITNTLPTNWEFTLPVKVGDNVEADLGGAFFPATITKVSGVHYDVQFFDGDRMDGLERSMIKLLVPPKDDDAGDNGTLFDGIDTSTLTKKELKRLRKKQEKLDRKQNKK